jgi:hypothetical protein
VLSGRVLCDELITRPEEPDRLWRVVVCDEENLVNEEAIARAGLQSQINNTNNYFYGETFRSGPGTPYCRGYKISLRHATIGRTPPYM